MPRRAGIWQERADPESVLGQGEQHIASAVADVFKFFHSFKNVKGEKADLTLFADICIQTPDRSGGKVPCIAVGFSVTAYKRILQTFKIALMDEPFAR